MKRRSASEEQQYQPGFLDKVLGRAHAKTAAAEQAIAQARVADENRYSADLKEHQGKLEEWKTLQRVAAGIAANQMAAFQEAFNELNPFAEIKELGRQVRLRFSPRYAEATIVLHGKEHVPREIKSLLKSGTVSTKPASNSHINQTYQTHVCSCVLRAARELFAVLPFQTVVAHGMADLLDPQTGHKTSQTIISALLPRSTFDVLDMERIDPVHAMRNFVNRMEFSKIGGFSAVNPINPKDYEGELSTAVGA